MKCRLPAVAWSCLVPYRASERKHVVVGRVSDVHNGPRVPGLRGRPHLQACHGLSGHLRAGEYPEAPSCGSLHLPQTLLSCPHSPGTLCWPPTPCVGLPVTRRSSSFPNADPLFDLPGRAIWMPRDMHAHTCMQTRKCRVDQVETRAPTASTDRVCGPIPTTTMPPVDPCDACLPETACRLAQVRTPNPLPPKQISTPHFDSPPVPIPNCTSITRHAWPPAGVRYRFRPALVLWCLECCSGPHRQAGTHCPGTPLTLCVVASDLCGRQVRGRRGKARGTQLRPWRAVSRPRPMLRRQLPSWARAQGR